MAIAPVKTDSGLLTSSKRIEGFMRLLDSSLEQRLVLAGDLSEFVPTLVTILRERAEGLWCEKVQTTVKGEQKVRVYQRAPDVKAVGLLLHLAGMFPQDIANALLALKRAESADVQLSVMKAQRLLYTSEAEKVKIESFLYKLSAISAEDLGKALRSLCSTAISFLQQLSVDSLADRLQVEGEERPVLSQAGWDEVVRQFVGRLSAKLEDLRRGEEGDKEAVEVESEEVKGNE